MPYRGKNGFVVNHASESADKGQGQTLGDKDLTLNVKHKTDTRDGTQAPGSPEVVSPPSGDSNAAKVHSTGDGPSEAVSNAASAAGRGIFSSVRNRVIAGVIGAAVVAGGVGVGVSASNSVKPFAPDAASTSASSNEASSSPSGWFSGVYDSNSSSSSASSSQEGGTTDSDNSDYDPSSGEAPKNASQLHDYLKSNGLDVSSDAGTKSSSASSGSSTSSSAPSPSQTVKLGDSGLQIENLTLNKKFSSSYNCDVVSVTGSLRNTSSANRYNYVAVQLALYDTGGTELGSQTVIFTGVAPGNSQPFSESAFSASPRTVASATSVKVVGYSAK